MPTNELKDKLSETLAICDLHYQRMKFAFNNTEKHFPLTETGFGNLTQMELALFDQLVYRFSKLQDSMGSRLFKQLLEALEEDISGAPFIDILQRMEKLNLMDNTRDWLKLRQIRNNVTHEYPFFKEVLIEELNLLPEEIKKLEKIWRKLEMFTRNMLKKE